MKSNNSRNQFKGERMMKKMAIVIMILWLFVLLGGLAFAEEKGPVQTVADGCKKDIQTYCKNVTPGEGRILACLFAYEDKLSNRCEYALYDAAAQLERAIAALTYLANECKDDLKTYCLNIKPGEGRLIDCIDKNMKKVSSRCKQAIKDVSRK
jgi:Cysteine rich repeat